MPLPKLRAPEEDGGILAIPPLSEWPGLVEKNRKLLSTANWPAQPLADHREMARAEAVHAAGAFHHRFSLSPMPLEYDKPAIGTGHQPDLFHPGVWIKNFATHALAQKLGAISINLVVDSDQTEGNTLRVPDSQIGKVELLAYDSPQPPMPFEERHINDLALFRTLPTRVSKIERAPLLRKFWENLLPTLANAPMPDPYPSTNFIEQAVTDRLGETIVIGRHRIEESWDCFNCETFISLLCLTQSFIHFASDLFKDLARFQIVYNTALGDYRRRHNLRSVKHPMPNLGMESDWFESPFWIWRDGDTHRRRLFIMKAADHLGLAAVGAELEELNIMLPNYGGPWSLSEWCQLREAGWKIRPRALITTLYARLFLADLFIHGLGGGLYDEITDDIIRKFFGFEPPAYVILTATLRLQDPNPPRAGGMSTAELRRQLRDLHYNPDRHLPPDRSSNALALVNAKQQRIARYPETKPERLERFLQIHDLNERLLPMTASEQERLQHQLRSAEAAEARKRLFHDREYAFVLHSEERLRELFAKVKFD